MTCDTKGGLCAYCTLVCHTDHDIFEVGFRGAFRCDCPTTLYPSACTFIKEGGEKLQKNTDNVYNQNFNALFCNCSKKIMNEDEDMMQCPLCADYFHPKCQNIPLELVYIV